MMTSHRAQRLLAPAPNSCVLCASGFEPVQSATTIETANVDPASGARRVMPVPFNEHALRQLHSGVWIDNQQ